MALFSERSVNDPLKRAKISTFISNNQVDILFLTESWLRQQGDKAKCADLAPMGYSVCSFPRPSRGGGIAVVYSDTLARCLISTSLFPFHHPSFEGVRTSLTLSPTSLHFVCVYRPPPSRKNKLTDAMFHDEFPDLLDFCNNLSGNCIILGDMNVHFDSPNNPCTAKLLNSLNMFNSVKAVNQPKLERGHTLD